MSPTSQSKGLSPEFLFDALNAYQRTAALQAAIDMDLFTVIAEGNATVPTIAARIQASEKGTRVLCDFLTVIGFLTKQAGKYQLTLDTATFLDRRSPAYLGTAAKFWGQMERKFVETGGLTPAVRKGSTVFSEHGMMGPEDPIWVEFARSMAPMMALPAQIAAQMIGTGSGTIRNVLDIAAGHGLYGITIAKQNPEARVVALDWGPVLEAARENAAKAGVAGRFSTISGDALQVDLGSGYDVVVIANFLQLLGANAIESLLKRVYDALAPGGRLMTIGFIPNDDRVSPPIDAVFGVVALSGTVEGDAYTVSEYERMFQKAGFRKSELRQLTPAPQRAMISHK